ncbi:MAG: hypothetical protein IKK11_01520 [Oscillospiraceae bacterium]|nr:hypothetical protein [Oscillospiraceae bacterium]
MRATTELFMIDRIPMLVPDENVEISAEDIDASDSGRDESGVMHRFVVRRGVRKWTFSYAYLTEEEYRYMESLFAGADTFLFAFPDRNGNPKEVMAYRSKYGILWHSAATGQYRNYQFNVVEC